MAGVLKMPLLLPAQLGPVGSWIPDFTGCPAVPGTRMLAVNRLGIVDYRVRNKHGLGSFQCFQFLWCGCKVFPAEQSTEEEMMSGIDFKC